MLSHPSTGSLLSSLRSILFSFFFFFCLLSSFLFLFLVKQWLVEIPCCLLWMFWFRLVG